MVDPKRSALMKRVRQKDTGPEQVVRAFLTKLGARYRTNVKDLPGRPDIANKKAKKAIFVHGCFWHAHSNCSKHRVPKDNRPFWEAKFEANVTRDAKKIELLEIAGFDVLVVWECELKDPVSLESRLRAYWFAGRERSDPPAVGAGVTVTHPGV